MAQVLITGGTGFVGGYVIDALLEAGHTVNALARGGDKSASKLEAKGVRIVPGDVMSPEMLEAACKGMDVVIHLVGIIRERPGAGFEDIHVGGTKNVVDAARAAGTVKRFVHMSALGTREDAVSRYHKTKWRAEEYVRASGLPYVIIRPSVIFGPGDEFMNKFKAFYSNPFFIPVIGDGKPLMQPVYAKDVARCYAIAVDSPAVENKTLMLAGPARYTMPQLLDLIGSQLGKKRLKIHIPISFMRIVAAAMEKFTAVPQITRDQLIMLREDNIAEQGEAEKLLGISFTRLEDILPTYI